MPRQRKAPHEKAAPRKIYASDPLWAEVEAVARASGHKNVSQYLLGLHRGGGGRPVGPALLVAQLQRLDRLHSALARIARRIEAEPASPNTARVLAGLVSLERRLIEMRPGRGDAP